MRRRDFLKTLAAGAAVPGALGQEREPPTRPRQPDVDYASTGVRLLSDPPGAGFRLPAEWERHERTLMTFPTRANWRARRLRGARAEWAAVARAIRRFEPVTMFADEGDADTARRQCGADVDVVELPLDSGWARDTGPLVIANDKGERRAVGFRFNGWGRKYPNYHKDALLKARIAKHLGLPMHAAPFVLEGGGITVDSAGTLIATRQCLLHPNRNPGVDAAALEKAFSRYLGVKRTIWLEKGLVPDPITDGHVDGICVFVGPRTVLVHTTDDRDDPNFAICRDAVGRLRKAKDARGRSLRVVELPLTAGELVHINFYLCNDAVIVPVTGDSSQDDRPLAIIGRAFPKREVVPVEARTIASGGGGIHCITQQVPAV